MGKTKNKKRARSSSSSLSSDSSSSASSSEDLKIRIKRLKKRLNRKKRAKRHEHRPRTRHDGRAAADIADQDGGRPAYISERDQQNADDNRQEDDAGPSSDVPNSHGELSQDPVLTPEVLRAIGSDCTGKESWAEPLADELVSVWNNLLKHGLSAELLEEIMKKYPTPGNFLTAAAPVVNKEVSTIVGEAALRRDARLSGLQNLVAAGLFALGNIVSAELQKTKEGDEYEAQTLEWAGDVGKILTHIHYEQGKSRRALLGSNLDVALRETLSEPKLDGSLFGTDLSERIKTIKAVEKTSVDLKKKPAVVARPATTPSRQRNLNYKRPLERTPLRTVRSGQSNLQRSWKRPSPFKNPAQTQDRRNRRPAK